MANIALVIKIDEEKYKRLLDKKQRYVGMTKYELTIANGTPFDDVLDKIKAEIEDYCERSNITCDSSISACLDIIDKYKV